MPISRLVHHWTVTKRLGPLPVWAWIVLAVVALLIAADAFGIMTGSGSVDPTDPLNRSS